ncbi:T-lymphoma invasion and metastasis-inducing protein 2 [Bagarius yarrelli]|uniref:T-lymphoma invasion and metastasis-inducing protein 2 n=1 Tax=Bagarius yarrelli TaxID=175774 RepID=A0A556VA70_BAGYA|nr:T-lymphoma invasion and metastasis-inducing protein 2 [Bagarius yarrelli]
MGNSESQFQTQGSRSSSFTLSNRQEPYPVRCRTFKEDSLTPHCRWRTGSSLKSKAEKRCGLSQHRANQSSLLRHCDYITKGGEGKRNISAQWNNGHFEENRRDCNGHALNGYKTPERKPKLEDLDDHSSPKVVIKSDGSVRVEFSHMSKNSTLPDENGGSVQLLKFSPTSHSVSTPESALVQNSPINRTSKRNSLSSEGSWYDSPWGPGIELNYDGVCALPNRLSETLPSVRIEYFDEPCIPRLLYRDPVMAATFSTAEDLKLANELSFKHRTPFLHVMEEPVLAESSGARQYSSYTLPCPQTKPTAENSGKKEIIKNRMRRFSDWTGSLTRNGRRSQSGIDGLTADTSSPSQVSSLLGYHKVQCRGRSQSQVLPSCSGGSFSALHPATDGLRQNIYDNFMRELETSQTTTGSGERRGENSAEDTESSSQETVGSLEQLDLLCEKEQDVVRRAGWLTFKPLLTLHKDRKLELVARRKWKQYWVTLKGCTLLFYETYGKGSPEQEASPSYALLAEDGIVQAVPEHPKKENVFCLSNAFGDVYLFQATSQTDLENWVTAIHSASASLFAKRHGKEDTPLLLRGQIRSLLQKIDMDGKMKKMAELQMSIVTDSKSRKAIENQICSRDEATLRKRSLSLPRRSRGKRGMFSSHKALDSLTKRSRDRRPCTSQRPDAPADTYSQVPPDGSRWERSVTERLVWVYMPDHQVVTVTLSGQHTVEELLNTVCKRTLPASAQMRQRSDGGLDSKTAQAFSGPGSVDSLNQSRIFVTQVFSGGIAFSEGLRPGDEILVLNGCQVSRLDLELIQTLFNVSCVSEGKAGVETRQHHRLSLRAVQHSKSAETVFALYHSCQDSSVRLMEVQTETAPPGGTLLRACPRHMSVSERLRKVVQELVDTEKSYVKDLSCLLEIYLKPLQKETFLTQDEMESLFGSLPEMLNFQKVFLQTLEERIASTPDFGTLQTPVQFRGWRGEPELMLPAVKVCITLRGCKHSSCAAKTDRAFKDFLDARNPTEQHSTTLESYLIKPVQRVLKYPLLLRELVSLTDTDSEEHYHLTEALKAMEKVASHINEMQKIHEDYGAVFDQLVAEQSGSEREVTEISIGEFLTHSSVMWLNPFPSLGRMKKEPELTVFDSNCMWDLIHTKSQLEGRPETLFQLCSSSPESRVKTLKTIRAILRENTRKGALGSERPAERSSKEQLAPLTGSSSRAFWLVQKPDSASESSGDPPTAPSSEAPPTNSTLGRERMRESDILSDDGWFSERSATESMESRFYQLRLSDETRVEPEGGEINAHETQPQLRRAHFSAARRRLARSDTRRSQAALLSLRQNSCSLDGQTDTAVVSADLNMLLERDFSVHSLTSVINEDCFYQNTTTRSPTTTLS